MKTSKVFIIMADGTDRDVTDKFAGMNDKLFARIVTATVGAGKMAPVSWERREGDEIELTVGDKAEIEYDKHCAKMKKAMSY